MAKLTEREPLSKEAQQEFERLRAADKLRALTSDESGTGINRLPNLRSFESHKLADGTVFVLGFLTSEEKASFEKASEPTDVRLFPEPKGSADQLVRVPATRVVSHVENSARTGTGLEIQVRPAS
jgi:hypothetical protein